MNEALRQLEMLLGNSTAGARAFPANSRYNATPVLMHRQADGRGNAYLARRFVPAADQFTELGQHTVLEGDRLDLLASRYLSDPEQYWKLCDANGALRPDALVEAIGRSLRIGIHTDVASPS